MCMCLRITMWKGKIRTWLTAYCPVFLCSDIDKLFVVLCLCAGRSQTASISSHYSSKIVNIEMICFALLLVCSKWRDNHKSLCTILWLTTTLNIIIEHSSYCWWKQKQRTTSKYLFKLLISRCIEGGMMRKGVKNMLEKLIEKSWPDKVGFQKPLSFIWGTSNELKQTLWRWVSVGGLWQCLRPLADVSVLIAIAIICFGSPFLMQG